VIQEALAHVSVNQRTVAGFLDLAPRSTSAGNNHDADPAGIFESRIGEDTHSLP
jgi:hypothetical protein